MPLVTANGLRHHVQELGTEVIRGRDGARPFDRQPRILVLHRGSTARADASRTDVRSARARSQRARRHRIRRDDARHRSRRAHRGSSQAFDLVGHSWGGLCRAALRARSSRPRAPARDRRGTAAAIERARDGIVSLRRHVAGSLARRTPRVVAGGGRERSSPGRAVARLRRVSRSGHLAARRRARRARSLRRRARAATRADAGALRRSLRVPAGRRAPRTRDPRRAHTRVARPATISISTRATRSPTRSRNTSMADVIANGVRHHVQRLGPSWSGLGSARLAGQADRTVVFVHGLVMDNLLELLPPTLAQSDRLSRPR